jgi:hypothetical protein
MEVQRHCGALTKTGRPCRAWAVRGSDPPRCAPHGGSKRPAGAPPGNTNAQIHGFYAASAEEITIDQAIQGLVDKMRRLDDLIAAFDSKGAGGNGEYLIRLLELYAQASSRLSRMLRDQRALSGAASDSLAGAVALVLDEIGTELGIDLTGP